MVVRSARTSASRYARRYEHGLHRCDEMCRALGTYSPGADRSTNHTPATQAVLLQAPRQVPITLHVSTSLFERAQTFLPSRTMWGTMYSCHKNAWCLLIFSPSPRGENSLNPLPRERSELLFPMQNLSVYVYIYIQSFLSFFLPFLSGPLLLRRLNTPIPVSVSGDLPLLFLSSAISFPGS